MAQRMRQGISYTVVDLRNAAWSAIKYAKCPTCGDGMRSNLGGDKMWQLDTLPGLAVSVSGVCKGKGRHAMTAREAL